MKKILLLMLAIGFALNVFLEQNPNFAQSHREQNTTISSVSPSSNQTLNNAYQNQQSDVQVYGSGIVIRTLADDKKGSQHQRFLVKLASGNTLLIAHNIDLAPRINALREGDRIEFYGEYEWNNKGGILHWTHHDPRGHHEGGWLKHNGSTYQ
ncbi:MAG: DUF3465 domain-containing protein [Methyloprofundus sp.]|nr:DUF3465 domain-containing protein [Methyloprofundus sp.]MDT8426210.1 DUF3465 domain-containing protein [Methyloprofundus sp.]